MMAWNGVVGAVGWKKILEFKWRKYHEFKWRKDQEEQLGKEIKTWF